MNIVMFLSHPVNLSPFYKEPVPLELFDVGDRCLYEKNYEAWKRQFPDSPVFVIDSSRNRIFSELCGNSDTLNIPSESVFSKTFIFSAFSCSLSLSPLTLFTPGYLDTHSLPALCMKVSNFLKTPLGADSLTFFSSGRRPSPLSIELGDIVFRKGNNEIFSIKKISPARDSRIDGFLSMSSVFTLNTFQFKDFLSETNNYLHEIFQNLEKSWKNQATLRSLLNSSIAELDSMKFEEVIINMEEKFAVNAGSMPGEIDTPGRLLGTLVRDSHGNYTEGEIDLSEVSDSLVINRSGIKLVMSNMKGSLVMASREGMRIESL